MGKRDLSPLTGVLFVVLVLVAFFALGGSTPEGDDSARKVASFYDDTNQQQIAAAVVLALSAVPLLAFSSILRERFRTLMPATSSLPSLAFGAGVLTAAGFCTAATLHFALADYGDNLSPVGAQALNALDGDFFLPFTVGLATMVLAGSLMTLKVGLLPKWLAWVGILIFVISFTPLGFIGFGLAGIWVIVVSILLFLRPAGPAGHVPDARPGGATV
jgi:hypothetical protein